jgi:Domain of unknown function (DUF4389)
VYPVRYEADYVEERGRAKNFFRLILIIPWYIVGSIYAIAATIVAFLAWFALLFTGRYPQGLYNFNAGVLRFSARAFAFGYLQTDEWPSFGFEQDPTYPIRAEIDPPLESYSRVKVFFRLIIGIPVMFMATLLGYVYQAASVVAWFHTVFVARSSGGIHNALTTGLAYQLRTFAYFLLMTETFPPVSDQAPAPNVGPGGATVPAAAAAVAPAAPGEPGSSSGSGSTRKKS